VDGQRFLRIAKLPVSSISGATELALDGYEIGEFLNGVGGTEQFRLADELMTGLSDPIPATYCIVQSGGVIFVVAGEFSSTSYSVICMTDSGEVIGSDYFTGRTPSSTTSDYMSINQAVVSPTDGGFYFAHPVGAGSEQFRFCKRSPTTGAIESYVDLDLNALGYEFASICPIPSASGVRIFGSQGSGLPCVYKDYDSSFSALSGWVVMDFGPDNAMDGGKGTFAARSGGFSVFGKNVSTDAGIFLIDNLGDFVSEVGDNPDIRSPLFRGPSSSHILNGPPISTNTAISRMLSDGTMA
jgi:hypothetical protein